MCYTSTEVHSGSPKNWTVAPKENNTFVKWLCTKNRTEMWDCLCVVHTVALTFRLGQRQHTENEDRWIYHFLYEWKVLSISRQSCTENIPFSVCPKITTYREREGGGGQCMRNNDSKYQKGMCKVQIPAERMQYLMTVSFINSPSVLCAHDKYIYAKWACC